MTTIQTEEKKNKASGESIKELKDEKEMLRRSDFHKTKTNDNAKDDEKSLDDDDDTSYGSEEDYDSDDSWTETVASAWKQHLVAVLVAVIATAIAMHYQKNQQSAGVYYYGFESDDEADYNSDVLSSISNWEHEHLKSYRRTANVSFCGKLQPRVDMQLQFLDFQIPKANLDAMKLHYAADDEKDDDYSKVIQYGHNEPTNPEYHCMKQLEEAETKFDYIRGVTYFHQPPTITQMFPNYEPPLGKRGKKGTIQPADLTFKGFAAKFINLSIQPVLLHWENARQNSKLVGEIGPMEALGTATTPGQAFYITPVYDSSHILHHWVLTADDPIVVFDDGSYDNVHSKITDEQKMLYQMHKLNFEYAKHYLTASKRVWLAHFPRPFPVHHMHTAAFVGQHIPVYLDEGDNNKSNPRHLVVKSVTPRVFMVDNFLSKRECEALMQMASDQGLVTSSLVTGSSSTGETSQRGRDLSARSSTNTWLDRDFNTDQIYRRAARLLQIDETSLGYPHRHHEDDPTKHSVAESIQVVRYKPGQEYVAHHDFTYPATIHRYQPTRFATLLMYLNDEGLEGGETNFPRAINPSNHEGLSVTPKQGRAVLFYNMLPDGNHDDLSQHSSSPVIAGEKWLANLWLWDPVIN